MKLVSAAALAAGALAAPLVTASPATAQPLLATCDGADCAPYVERNIDTAGACVTDGNRYVFGLTASGDTFLCTVQGKWIPQPPLVGVRTQRAPCGDSKGVAQSPDGRILSCIDGAWTLDFTPFYF